MEHYHPRISQAISSKGLKSKQLETMLKVKEPIITKYGMEKNMEQFHVVTKVLFLAAYES